MKTKYAFIIGLLTLATLSSCSKQKYQRGSGSIVSEIRQLQGFDAVELNHSAEVILYQDSVFFVEVRDYQNIVGYIETVIVGNKLVIGIEKHTYLRNSQAQVIIHLPRLSSLILKGSGKMETIGSFEGFRNAEISGSGKIIAHGVHTNGIMNFRISGSGEIRANGSCSVLEANISGSGNGHLFNLLADTVFADISGSGSLNIYAKELIDASISGSGHIAYMGSPIIRSTITGSGKI